MCPLKVKSYAGAVVRSRLVLFGRTFCDGGGGLEPLLSNRTTIGHTGRTGFCILFNIKLFKFNHISLVATILDNTVLDGCIMGSSIKVSTE